ncbi:MAG: BrnA antitoxin family protein [Treponema sp.]|nr:BrnA antitoxin family protein [Treponema sp.]
MSTIKEKVIYSEAPEELAAAFKRARAITDFLPPPWELVPRESKVKVTIALSGRSVDFFKRCAAENNTGYQAMINEVLNRYVEKYEVSV